MERPPMAAFSIQRTANCNGGVLWAVRESVTFSELVWFVDRPADRGSPSHPNDVGKETTMGILSWIVFGLIAGALAKLIMPGKDPGGIIVTILIGIAGAVIGGFIGNAIGFGKVNGFDFRSFVIAIVGSLILLAGYRMMKKA
jgi:uncharacterized membrane protein YeaQ/YmgE (transglycosylase-associated protein family)